MSHGQWGNGGPQPPQYPQQQYPQWQSGQPAAPQTPATPDWGALAEEAERTGRRRRWLLIGGGALAALAIGTGVALAIVNQGGGGNGSGASSSELPTTDDLPAETTHPEPSFQETTLPPIPQPVEFISDADKDLAPFTQEGFFAGETMAVEGREYARRALHTAEGCAGAGTPELTAVLQDSGCLTMLRATYTTGGVAVTVGVAQFPGEAEAEAAKEAAGLSGGAAHLLPLSGGGVAEFCDRGGCRVSRNQIGRYVYLTIAGNADGTPDSGDNTPAQQASRDGNTHAHARIVQRGESQASASAEALVQERNRQDEDGDG
ncbi:hypothetical protein [Streptomyces aidingensis]|uniref:PknH-like extracellular domain-containing protein n=1 Tax=Streptomyces aidingensis TaxID=910347 RepID=A0A1I1E896_9ACTN|nr:hypothetical protein [Streptomyces aidingensis]SFB83314.1 hypothetical protein SAMN05421773_101184 [Streptomyces aidingensis]